MLTLAAAAVGLYVAGLYGVWDQLGLGGAYVVVALVIDVIFVLDLAVKLAAQRSRYLSTPWFVVDLVCALPILSTAALLPSVVNGLRLMRMFRLLRALRMLRVLRGLRMLRFLGASGERTREQRTYQRVLTVTVVAYAVGFLALVTWAQSLGGDPVAAERNLVLGSLLGMLLVLVVARYQIPALWSQQVRALLNVALPSQVARHFLDHPEAYDNDVRAPATVLFCDIKGFTTTVESLGLDEVKSHLEAALNVIVDAHVAQDLIIDKFIGDAVMSFRGGNLVSGTAEDHAYRVVRGGLDGVLALRALGDPHFHTLKVGGASAIDALIGTFGTSKRLSYTILGDRVNLAARLEGSCNALGVRTLFCGRTRQLVGERADLVWRRVGRVSVQGKDETTEAWEVFDSAESTAFLDDFHRALQRFEARDLEGALAAFEAIEDDGASVAYAAACRRLAKVDLPDDWTPVIETTK